MTKVLVETDNDEIHEDLNVDGRGRVTLGSEYADADSISLAVTEIDGEPVSERDDSE